jgi:hypothetical protein
MLEQGNGTDAAFDWLLCRVNGTAIDLKTAHFETDKYFTGGGVKSGAEPTAKTQGLLMLVFAMLAAVVTPLLDKR